MNLDTFITAAESLTKNSVDQFAEFYAINCVFTDPFQTAHGRQQVRDIYSAMFDQLDRPRFSNVRVLGSPSTCGTEAMIGWTFEFALGPNKPRQAIPGCSLLTLNADGLVQTHHDYWDASRVMEALPLVGRIIHWIREKIGHSHKS
jgi:steroid Delta-isomerase